MPHLSSIIPHNMPEINVSTVLQYTTTIHTDITSAVGDDDDYTTETKITLTVNDSFANITIITDDVPAQYCFTLAEFEAVVSIVDKWRDYKEFQR